MEDKKRIMLREQKKQKKGRGEAKEEKLKRLQEKRKRAGVIVRRLKKIFPHAGMVLRYSNHFELLVAVELSAQCTDVRVNIVTKKLFQKYRTLDDYIAADPREFEKDIYTTGFYKNKTRNILAAARMVKEKYGGELPKTMEEMLLIPGVARKTANVVLGNAFGIVEGIAVDTHVRRLSRLWRLTSENDPVKIERNLMEILPKKDWFEFTYLTIEYGRKYCPARKRDHAGCPLAEFEQST
ncbi:MAG TPA: endonuclease III [Candidatus Paceibacterota bacterium]|nr:endonuclease III [Candidatus Paceibacterota bacterium]